MKKIISTIIALTFVMSAALIPSYAESVPHFTYKEDTGVYVNMYTGYIGGFAAGTTADGLTAMMKNPETVVYKRGEDVLGGTDALLSGDTATLEGLTLTVALMGDANNDGKISISDVTFILKYIAHWAETDNMNTMYADSNGDGTIGLGDVTHLLKIFANWDVELAKTPVVPTNYTLGMKKTVQTFTKTTGGNYNLCHGEELAMKFTVGEKEVAQELHARVESWDNAGYPTHGEADVSVYVWRGGICETLADAPVYTMHCEDNPVGSEIVFKLTDGAGQGLGAGDYLVLFHNGYDYYDFYTENPDGSVTKSNRGFGLQTWSAPSVSSGLQFWAKGNGETVFTEWNSGFDGGIVLFDLK